MRKVTFIDTFVEIKKLMIYGSKEGVYLFGYDCVQDTTCIWGNWYLTFDEAEDYCEEKYHVEKKNGLKFRNQ